MNTIGRYEIVGRIGSGGFATVYRARDPELDSEVAVKVLADNWSGNDEIRDRFIREAKILRRIDSDRVVTVYDIGELPNGQPFFVMALADRGTLQGRIETGIQPTLAEVTTVARAMADCIAVVHRHGLIHRDIKPSNLLIARSSGSGGHGEGPGLLGPGERLVLGDFGLVKDIELHSTGATIAAGSGGYAAPEQMALAGAPNRRTDLFAATGVMYRVLSGTRPPSFDLINRVIPFPDDAWWMSAQLGSFFRRGMAYEPEHRHPSIEEWLADLAGAMAPYDSPVIPPEPTSAIPPVTQLTAGPGGISVLPVVGRYPDMVPPPSAARYQGHPGSSDLGGPGPGFGNAPPPTPSYDRQPGGPAPIRVVAPPRRGRRWLLVTGVLAVVGLAVAGGLTILAPDRPTIVGPNEIVAGERAEYQATFEGADVFEWIDPAGAAHTGPILPVDGWVPGSVRVSVRAVIGDSRSAEAVKTIEVVPAPDGPVIEGPNEIPVNQPTIYRFTYDGEWSTAEWILPDGSRFQSEEFEVTPVSPGSLRLILLLTRADGTRIGTARNLQLTS